MKTQLALVVFLFFAINYSVVAQEESWQSLAEQQIVVHDKNGDGALSKFEVQFELYNDFNKIDKNKDDLLDALEIQIYIDKLSKKAKRDKDSPCYTQLITPYFD